MARRGRGRPVQLRRRVDGAGSVLTHQPPEGLQRHALDDERGTKPIAFQGAIAGHAAPREVERQILQPGIAAAEGQVQRPLQLGAVAGEAGGQPVEEDLLGSAGAAPIARKIEGEGQALLLRRGIGEVIGPLGLGGEAQTGGRVSDELRGGMAELQIAGGDLADREIGLAQGRGQEIARLGGERQPAHGDALLAVAEREPGRLELHIGRLTLGRRECDRHLGADP